MAVPPSQSPASMRNSMNGYANSNDSEPSMTPREYMAGLKKQFDYTFAMMEYLFEQKEHLTREYDNSQLDLVNMNEQNRDLRKQVGELKRMVEVRERELACNHYTLVLVDGDGMTFRRDLIKEGRAGGEKAANRLSKRVLEDTKLKPIIRVFANVEGLSRAMKTQQLTTNVTAFREFAQGFSDPRHEQIDFIDVGEGKEMADWKLKSELEWHLKNYNCRRIILGASHDNGYARVLKKVDGKEALEKIHLLEGPPFGKEFDGLLYKRLKYEEVFSPEKFDVYMQPRSPVLSMASPTPAGAAASASAATKVNAPINSYAAAANAAPAITPPTSVAHNSPRLTKAAPQISESQILEATRKVKQLRPKPCNNHYLKGDCNYGDDECTFGHKYPLKPDELAAMRRLAAQKQCNFGQECINERCYYSHD